MGKKILFILFALSAGPAAYCADSPAEPTKETAEVSAPQSVSERIFTYTGRDPFVVIPAKMVAGSSSTVSGVKLPKNYAPDPGTLSVRGIIEYAAGRQAFLYDSKSGRTYIASNGKLCDVHFKPVPGMIAIVAANTVTLTKGGRSFTLAKKKK
ncbi:MAG: hypothetical protein WCS77_10115 [Elusimicrobiaceae bacterium]